jgi:hypothetical protein
VITRPLVSMTSCLVLFAVAASAQMPIAPTPLPPVDVDVVASAAQTPAPAQAQAQAQAPVAKPGAKTTQPTPTPQAPVTQVVPGPPKKVRGRDVNVQIELTITEHQGGAPGEKRVVSMIVADAAFGRIRSTASQDVKLNIDATPTMLDNDRIALELTIEYIPITPEGATRRPAGLLEMLTVILQNGKPLQISQAADPTIDRRITAEVRASVLK